MSATYTLKDQQHVAHHENNFKFWGALIVSLYYPLKASHGFARVGVAPAEAGVVEVTTNGVAAVEDSMGRAQRQHRIQHGRLGVSRSGNGRAPEVGPVEIVQSLKGRMAAEVESLAVFVTEPRQRPKAAKVDESSAMLRARSLAAGHRSLDVSDFEVVVPDGDKVVVASTE